MKRIFCLVLSLLILIGICGCDGYDKDASIYFELYELPKTVDAQTAETISELIAVRNLYEGLTRKNENGELTLGVAESYEFNNNTYTFKLKEDLVWNDETPLTAYDFEFAFKRAVDPNTAAPFVSRLFAIKNAKQIYLGKANKNALGIKALDEKTLQIKLDFNDKSFFDTLSTSIAMPCNEDFFNNSIGKYGLTAEYTLSNGSYYLSRWNQESFKIKLSRNEKYTGEFVAKNGAVFLTRNEEVNALTLLKDDDVDASFIDCALIEEAEKYGLSTQSFENTCWILTISDELPYNIRKSLALLCGSDSAAQKLKSGFRTADSLFPSVYSDEMSNTATKYDLEKGKQLYFDSIKQLENKKFPSQTVLKYYDNGYFKDYLTATVGHWQNNLGAYVNIEAVDSKEKLTSQIINQTNVMSVFPVSSPNNDLSEYLMKFGIKDTSKNLKEVQKSLIESYNIIPLAFSNTTIAYGNGVENMVFDTENGYIDFSFATKKQ